MFQLNVFEYALNYLIPLCQIRIKLVLNAIGSKESSLKFEEINFGQEIDCIPTLFPRIEFK